MHSSHPPSYHTPNASSSGVPLPPSRYPTYQHWLDDAAQMGLMLFRMRHDSKRERILSQSPPPSRMVPTTPPSNPVVSPPARHQSQRVPPIRTRNEERVSMVTSLDATPRTTAALNTPTVTTESHQSSESRRSNHHRPTHPPLD